ncbi:hypothetical protein JOY44_12190 [Phormidium sp. CLA17]|uniref:hypothetical protein n=1 Tax=Leptolyngbya sp. Cla-17 TaxID=2803751 RepID=UPI0014913107|nr:hypothetical protein [Leptolyngbya sp. Cla-17]MBM0742369.1 hypothetical protein [Leptolyngbya sp. Cla-17]
MPTDYVLFIHGVNTHSEPGFRRDAQYLFDRIQASVKNPSRNLKPIYLFWGNVSEEATKLLLEGLKASPKWSDFWFQKLRTQQILPFVGDAALYLSRHVSAKVVRQISTQALQQMGLTLGELQSPPDSSKLRGDRLHLVTHSWGTVILFDILFAPRWDAAEVDLETRQNIDNIRAGFFGLGSQENEEFGIPVASIHTMGSPISLFSLINAAGGRSFNLTPKLKELLETLYGRRDGNPLPWRNYAHPGDPIAYPLAGVLPILLEGAQNTVRIEDIVVPGNSLMKLFSQTMLPLINGGDAHGSYWKSKEVAAAIAQTIQTP